MPKRNYGFEKRQKEISRQQKQEAKRQRRMERSETPPEESGQDRDPVDQPPEE